jgi:hypothetical protein
MKHGRVDRFVSFFVCCKQIFVGPLRIEFHEESEFEEIRMPSKKVCGVRRELAAQSMDKRTLDSSPNRLTVSVQQTSSVD